MENKKQYIIVGFIILAAILVAVLILTKSHSPNNSAANKTKTSVTTGPGNPNTMPATADLDAKALTALLPKGFPTESGGTLLRNSKIADPKTKTITILRTTTTAKTLADAMKAYKDYFTKNTWTIIDTTDAPTLKVLKADKGTAHMIITTSFDGGSKSNIVVVNYTTPQ